MVRNKRDPTGDAACCQEHVGNILRNDTVLLSITLRRKGMCASLWILRNIP